MFVFLVTLPRNLIYKEFHDITRDRIRLRVAYQHWTDKAFVVQRQACQLPQRLSWQIEMAQHNLHYLYTIGKTTEFILANGLHSGKVKSLNSQLV